MKASLNNAGDCVALLIVCRSHRSIGEAWLDSSILSCASCPTPEVLLTEHNISNHPVIKDDGLLTVFLTEPSFEAWRKANSISYEEESASKRVDRIEEMAIPSDLEEKLAYVNPICHSVRLH